MKSEPINAPPGAHIEVRDAVWRVVRVDTTITGSKAWHTVGVSEIVRDQDAIFLEEYEPEVTVLDPRDTGLVLDSSLRHRAAQLFLESKLRRVPPLAEKPELAKQAAMDGLDFQLEPTKLAHHAPFDRETDYDITWAHFERRFANHEVGEW